MPKYKVLRAIELDGKLYLPASDDAPAKARSSGNGAVIPVDASGVIELSDAQAKELTGGQVEAISDPKPASSKKKTPKSEAEG